MTLAELRDHFELPHRPDGDSWVVRCSACPDDVGQPSLHISLLPGDTQYTLTCGERNCELSWILNRAKPKLSPADLLVTDVDRDAAPLPSTTETIPTAGMETRNGFDIETPVADPLELHEDAGDAPPHSDPEPAPGDPADDLRPLDPTPRGPEGSPMPMTTEHATRTLLPQHVALITASSITDDVAQARGYRSVTVKADLGRVGFGSSQRIVPTLLIPIHNVTGKLVSYQHRPDHPRIVEGKPLKYETPRGSHMVLDVPLPARPWLGDHKLPLFITEGARKADSAVSRGLCCLSLLGVWNWRGTNEHGGATALADWELVALKGRVVYIVFDSDLVTNPHVFAALVRFKAFLELRGALVWVIYLPHAPGGATQKLDDFFVAGGTVEGLLALATEEVRRPPETRARETDAGPYRVEAGHICRDRSTRDGMITEALCNFTAQVDEEVVLDDGVETTRAFVLTGRLDTGEALPAARVSASRFAGMTWVPDHWGLRAVVRAGLSTRDCLREAIQRLSPEATRRHVYTHTGWREIDGRWVYLTAGGAIGRDGVEMDLGPELTRYCLPAAPSDAVGAFRASLALLKVAPLSITVPLWAAMYRAPLIAACSADFSVWLEGPTHALKSSLAAAFLNHFGEHFERLTLPGAWSSTANALERRAFLLKDIVFVIDDYATSSGDLRDLELKAARLLRAQGNLAGRGRLRADLSERPAYPPRGLILSTGEQHPPGQSLLARTLVIPLKSDEVDLARLTVAQSTRASLSHAMAAYVGWLVPQMPTLASTLRAMFEGTRAKVTVGAAHRRIPEVLAHLWLGLSSGLKCAEEFGACTLAEAATLREDGWAALTRLGDAQSRLLEEERPTHRFLRVLVAVLTQGRHVLLPREDSGKGLPPPGLELVGWFDPDRVYLVPESAYAAVARHCRDAGEPFPVRQVRLAKDLGEEGLTECDPHRHTHVVYLAGRTRRVWALRRADSELLLGQEIPTWSPATGAEK